MLRDHGEDIAVLEAKVQELERGKNELFKLTKEIGDVANENKYNTNYIKDKLDKGEIVKPLERKIDTLCNEFTKVRREVADSITQATKRSEDRLAEITSSVDDHAERLETVEKSSWVTDILAIGFKKLLVGAVIAALIIGLANTAWWGLAKTYVFKEAPKQQQQLFLHMKNGNPPVVNTEKGEEGIPIKISPKAGEAVEK